MRTLSSPTPIFMLANICETNHAVTITPEKSLKVLSSIINFSVIKDAQNLLYELSYLENLTRFFFYIMVNH